MPDRVVDASVLAVVFFRERRRYQEAVRLTAGSDLFEPTLVNYEMANIARNKIVNFPQQREAILESLQGFLNLNVHWVDVDYLRVVDLAATTGLTTYDASYLYVARERNIPLITFDAELQRVARNWGGS